MVGEITYKYTPDSWNQAQFEDLGGFVVVFLNYNKARWIEKAVASALGQDYPLLEMFFMDDASSDGSGDTMEQIVRDYRGRHKVTVVRNSENQHIAGQWNIVAKLASGSWLGMFCGDDVSHSDRVSLVAERLRRNSTVLSICTASHHLDYRDGHDCGFAHYGLPYVVTGNEIDYGAIEKDIDGATSFYHISLFESELTRAPLDDYLLRWVLMCKHRQDADDMVLVTSDIVTVDYTKGSGISSENTPDGCARDSIAQWLANARSMRSFANVEKRSRIKILEYMEGRYSNDDFVRDRAYNRYRLMHASIACGNTLTRSIDLPRVMALIFSRHLGKRYKIELMVYWLRRFLLEIFGLKVAALFGSLIHKRGCSRLEGRS